MYPSTLLQFKLLWALTQLIKNQFSSGYERLLLHQNPRLGFSYSHPSSVGVTKKKSVFETSKTEIFPENFTYQLESRVFFWRALSIHTSTAKTLFQPRPGGAA